MWRSLRKKVLLIPHSTASTELLFTHLPFPSCHNLLAHASTQHFPTRRKTVVSSGNLEPFHTGGWPFSTSTMEGRTWYYFHRSQRHRVSCTRPNQKGNKGMRVICYNGKKQGKKATWFSFSLNEWGKMFLQLFLHPPYNLFLLPLLKNLLLINCSVP